MGDSHSSQFVFLQGFPALSGEFPADLRQAVLVVLLAHVSRLAVAGVELQEGPHVIPQVDPPWQRGSWRSGYSSLILRGVSGGMPWRVRLPVRREEVDLPREAVQAGEKHALAGFGYRIFHRQAVDAMPLVHGQVSLPSGHRTPIRTPKQLSSRHGRVPPVVLPRICPQREMTIWPRLTNMAILLAAWFG